MGGIISFVDAATGGTSQVELYGNGGLAISLHNPGSVAIGSLAGDGKVVLGSNNLAVGGNNLNTTFSGVIEGSGGSLTKEGTGTLTLSGSNSYSGGTTVTAGTLAVKNDHSTTFGTLGSGTATVKGGALVGQNGGTLAFLDSADAEAGSFIVDGGAASGAAGGIIRFGGTSSAGSAKLIANGGSNGGSGGGISFVDAATGGTSQVELYGNGGLAISLHNAGSVAIGSLAGDGKVVLGSNNLAVGGNNRNTTFSGAIEGAGGSLTKEGTGTLVLEGENTYSGETIVSAGTLLVNGTLSASQVTVQAGATLGGSGVLADLVLEDGSFLAPGNSIDTLSLDSLTWNGGAELLFELGESTSDQLILSGALSKGDPGTFNFAFEDSGWQVGETYTLIEFESTDFELENFAFTNGDGFDGYFELNGNRLEFTLDAVPEPSTWGLMIAGLLLSGLAARKNLRTRGQC